MTRACPLHGEVRPPTRDSDLSYVGVGVGVGGGAGRPLIPGFEDMLLVASGGFGVVYRATDRKAQRTVAIKVAREDRPGAHLHLEAEVRALAEIGPPHVPAVLGRGETSAGTPYFIMEDLGDETLAARLTNRREPLPLEAAIDLATAIVRALAVVHDEGYVHRDLKPENIFVDGALRATLIDFGLVLAAEAVPNAKPEKSGEGPAVGTAEYMSPEQCEGMADVDARTDIYAVGVILQELLTCRPPFWGPRAVVREMQVSHRPPRVSSMVPERAIPSVIDDLVACCLAKDRRERFASARDLLHALEAAHGEAVLPEAPALPSLRSVVRHGPDAGRLTAGIVFFVTEAEPTVVLARLEALGGRVAHGAGGRYAAVFAQEMWDNPAQRALLAARDLVHSGFCARARVDLAPVVAQSKKDGTRRFLSPLFARPERYPSALDPPVFITPVAAAVLPQVDQAAPLSELPLPTTIEALSRSYTGSEGDSELPLLGRDELVAELVQSALQGGWDGLSTAVTLTGDSGTGKSRLFRELARRLAAFEPEVAVLVLKVREPTLGDRDRTLVELLRWGLDVGATSPGAAGSGAQVDADLPAVVALALGRGALSLPGSGGEPPLRSLSAAPGALRSAMTRAAGEALRRKAAGRPLCILLDNAHLVGDVALAALEYAVAAEPRLPIWVCLIGRPALVQEHPAWGERAGRRELRSLGPLDMESAGALCRRLLLPVETVPDSAVRHLVERAQATPLLLVELIRGLHREGIVRKSPKGQSWYLATDELDHLPDLPLVEWFARREIDGLAPALRGHARLLALLGERVTEAEIEAIVRGIDERGGDPDLPLDAKVGTQRLLAAGVIVKDASGRFGYRQAIVGQMLARTAPEAFARRVHLSAADHYRTGDALEDQHRLSRLARHAAAAGLAEDAARSFFVLAERARAWHAYLDAERLYGCVLEQPSLPGGDRAPAYRGRGLMRYRLSRYHDALADLEAARALVEEDGDVTACIDLLLDEATVLDWMDDFAGSELRVREAEARLPAQSPPLLHARLLLGLGRSAHRWSRNEEAVRILARAAAAAEPLGDEGYETLVIALLLLSFILPTVGWQEEARRAVERTVALAEAHGDRLHLGGALNNRAMLRGSAGDREGMVADMERSIAIARELGQASLELMGEFNLGEYLLLMADPQAAAPHITRALALDLAITGHPGRAVVALLGARLRLYLDDVEGALAISTAIRTRQEEARASGAVDPLSVPSDEILCSAIELSARGGTAEQWDELEGRSVQLSVGQERIEVIESRAAAAQRAGRIAEARMHLARAIALAVTIPNAMAARLAGRLADLDRLTA